jgi:hypothetical protein
VFGLDSVDVAAGRYLAARQPEAPVSFGVMLSLSLLQRRHVMYLWPWSLACLLPLVDAEQT